MFNRGLSRPTGQFRRVLTRQPGQPCLRYTPPIFRSSWNTSRVTRGSRATVWLRGHPSNLVRSVAGTTYEIRKSREPASSDHPPRLISRLIKGQTAAAWNLSRRAARNHPPPSPNFTFTFTFICSNREVYRSFLLDVDSARCVISIFWCLGGWLEGRVWINKEIRRLGLNEIIILSRMEGWFYSNIIVK